MNQDKQLPRVGNGEERKVNKLFENHWFIKIISFFIALMLFLMVNQDNLNNQPTAVTPPMATSSYTLEDVQLTAYYDEDRFAITEISESVQVNLRGPQSIITLLQISRPSYEVFVDLTEREAGVHHVNIEHKGFPNELSVSIVPQFTRVVIQEKKTVSIPVEVDLVNQEEVAEGYSVGTPIVTPVNVEITAAEELIDQVAIAKAYVDVRDANETIEKAVPIKIYDHFGNELHLDVEPSVVDVKVPITSPFKTVPIKISREGTLPDGLSIDSIQYEPREVTIFGPQNVINDISLIEGIVLDLSTITENQTVQLDIPRPRGVERIEPNTVEVTIELTEEATRTIDDVPLEVTGISEGYEVEIVEPATELISVMIRGADELIERVTREELQAFIDVSQLTPGEHDIEIQIVGPQNMVFETEIPIATVVVREDEDE